MAEGKYKRWLEPEGLLLLEGWAKDGLTDEQIAKKMGINTVTLYRYKKDHSNICNALKKGKEIVDYEVENALYSSALAGNTTAQIFWLKNRRPDKWREKQENDNGAAIEKLSEILEEVKKDAIDNEAKILRRQCK